MATGDPILGGKSIDYILVLNIPDATAVYTDPQFDLCVDGAGYESCLGTFASPSTSTASTMAVQKFSAAPIQSPLQFTGGAGTFAVCGKSGSQVSALTGIVTPYGTTGDMCGVSGVAYAMAGNTGPASVWAGYFVVTTNSGNFNSWGVEIGIYNGGSDRGYTLATAPTYGSTVGLAVFASDGGEGATFHCSTGITIGAQIGYSSTPDKWHIGLLIMQNSIVPTSGTENQGILLRGGSATGYRYGGMKFSDYLDYGIDMNGAIINSTEAVRVSDGHLMTWWSGASWCGIKGSGGAMYFTNNSGGAWTAMS